MEESSWLDKIIEEQAAHYGMPIDKFKGFMSDVASEQERREREKED